MNGSLDRLVARNLGEVPSLRPRPVSVFEPEFSRLDHPRTFLAAGWGEPIVSVGIEREVFDETPEASISRVQAEPSALNLGTMARPSGFEVRNDHLGEQDSTDGPRSPTRLNRELSNEHDVMSEVEKGSLVGSRAQEMHSSDERLEEDVVPPVSSARPAAHDFLSAQYSRPTAPTAAPRSYKSTQPELRDELATSTTAPYTVPNEASGQNMVVASTTLLRQSKDQRRRKSVLPSMVTADRRAPHQLATQPDATPSVHVTIGRIEIRAETPAAAGGKVERTTSPVMGLDEYLRQKNARGNK
jgi:hypothetical protein